VLISFDRNLWAITYSYSGLSHRFTGHEVDKTSKSGSRLAFLKRYLYPGQKFIVFAEGKYLGEG